MKQYGSRLSTRIIIGAIVIVVAGALALMFIEEARLRDVYKSGLRTDLQQSLNTEKLRLGQAINTLRQDVLFLSNTPPVSGIVRAALNRGHDLRYGYTSKIWEERLQQIFSAFSAAHPDYYQIRYIGVADGGRELVRVDNHRGKFEITPSARLQAKGDRDYFKATLGLHAGEVYLSEFNLNRERGAIEQPYRPTLRAATPVFTPSGQIFGMVVINMEASRLLESATSGLPAGAQTYITNMNGEYLLHPDAPRSFGFELGRMDKITTDFPFLKTLFIPRTSGHFPLQAVEMETGAQHWAAERIHFDSGDPARFLVLAYSIPDAVAAQQIITIPPTQIIGGFIAMLLVSGIALLVLRRTFSPLEQITAAADKIAAGNHDVQLPQTGSGEIGSLANALGAMLARLAQREQDILQINTGLEERVRERTFELNAINELLHGLKGKKLLQETEKLLRRNQALMLTSMDGICVLDSQGNIVTVNDAFCRMLGYTQVEAAGLNVADWDMQWTADRLRERFMVPFNNSAIVESMHRRKDGTLMNVEISIAGVVIEGQFLLFASSRDITGRKQVEEALRIAAAAFETQDAIMITNADGNIIRVNHAFSVITGYSPEEVLGKNLSMMNSGQDCQDSCIEMLQQSIHNGSWAGEILCKRKNGQFYPIWMTVTAIKNERQETTHCVSIFSDITARKQTEQARLRESEERFRGTLEQAAVGIAHASLDGYFQQVNQKFCEIVGYTRDELIHMNFQDISFPADMDENRRYIQQLLADEIPTFSMEKRYVRKDRSMVWVNLTVSLLRGIDGTPKYTIGVIEDITGRKQSEELAQRFGRLLQSSFNEIYLFDASSLHFLQASEGAKKNLGYSSEELNQITPLDLKPSFTREGFEQLLGPLRRGEQQVQVFEASHQRKDGTTYPVEVRLQYIETGPGAFLAIIQDITERKRLEENLQRSETKFRTVYESSSDAIMLLDEKGFFDCNATTLRMFGCSTRDDFINKHPSQFSPPTQPDGQDSKSLADERIATAFRNGNNRFEWLHCRLDGAEFLAEVLLTSMVLNGRQVQQATVRDITERKRAEQQLRDLSAHLQTVREEEKASVAREIHDDLGGALTALKMDAYWLARNLPAGNEMAQLRERVESMSGLINNAVAVTRRIITDLRPTILDDLGLLAALEWQAAQFSKRTGIECHVVCACGGSCENGVDKIRSINLFRIFQEALTNIARHSGASRVEVELQLDDKEVSLSISDNGRGLPEEHTIASTSYGIRGMRERAEQLDGRIKIDSQPGGGLCVRVILPLNSTVKP